MMGETGVGLLWCHPAQVVAEGDRLIERGKGAKADAFAAALAGRRAGRTPQMARLHLGGGLGAHQ